MEAIAKLLPSQREIGSRKTTELPFEGKRYQCFQIDLTQVTSIRQLIADTPDVITMFRLFAHPEGSEQSMRDVTSMLKKNQVIRNTVLENLSQRGRNGRSPSRTKLVRVAK